MEGYHTETMALRQRQQKLERVYYMLKNDQQSPQPATRQTRRSLSAPRRRRRPHASTGTADDVDDLLLYI
jgi:hypothetical protein